MSHICKYTQKIIVSDLKTSGDGNLSQEAEDGFDAQQRRRRRLRRQRGISRRVTVEDGKHRQQVQIDVEKLPIGQVVLVWISVQIDEVKRIDQSTNL